jgi:hypothetical protein
MGRWRPFSGVYLNLPTKFLGTKKPQPVPVEVDLNLGGDRGGWNPTTHSLIELEKRRKAFTVCFYGRM